MIYRDVTFSKFRSESAGKKILCIGAGTLFDAFIEYTDESVKSRVIRVFDNAPKRKLQNGIPVSYINDVYKYINGDTCILITSMYCKSLMEQLDTLPSLKFQLCYLYPVMSQRVENYSFPQSSIGEQIPKVIHWFWFGKGEIPDENKRCIDSWYKYCPNYEIKKWTEDNYDITKNKYMLQAYERKKWGFVPDYARLDVVYRYGGIYLDTDVELIKTLDDLLQYKAFAGFQRNFFVALGLGFGAKANLGIIRKLLEFYNNIEFLKDGNENLTPSPNYQTKVLCENGLICDNTLQKVEEMYVFPSDLLDPKGSPYWGERLTKNTCGIHHYCESWVDKQKSDVLKKRYLEVESYL